jgi:hypothetical protein
VHIQHRFNEVPGFGVLVISACMGESAKKHRTIPVTKTSSMMLESNATKPFLVISLKLKRKN